LSSFLSPLDPLSVNAEGVDWYALQVKSKFTRNVANILECKGYEAFTPYYSVERRWCDRIKTFELPVLLGYVFVKMDLRYRMPVLTTPGVYNVVGVGRQPIPIQQEEIDTVRGLMRSGLLIEPWPYLKRGDRVRIEDGPLRGLTGILVDVRNSCRVVISVQAIERSIAVHVHRDCVSTISSVSMPTMNHRGIARAATNSK
jgi:transcription antitermination factor NusG